jgi:ubiquinone/menaquinone biosynthesis C-methylase UbiE
MQPLYNSIGSTYGATRRADPAIARQISRLVNCTSGSRFLDVACGTGNYTCALAALGGEWHGTDISEVMLKQAMEKNSGIEWAVGSIESLPYQDGLFDGIVCSLAIHHFAELDTPFREVWRVLKKGKFVIFTAFPEQMQNYWLCHYFPEMMRRSCEKMPSKQSVVASLQLAGFEIASVNPFLVTNQLQDLFLYSGKERPEFYLDPVVRANISSFASLCAAEELEQGLLALRADIASKRFNEVSQHYKSRLGDYAYVVATKGANGGN